MGICGFAFFYVLIFGLKEFTVIDAWKQVNLVILTWSNTTIANHKKLFARSFSQPWVTSDMSHIGYTLERVPQCYTVLLIHLFRLLDLGSWAIVVLLWIVSKARRSNCSNSSKNGSESWKGSPLFKRNFYR